MEIGGYQAPAADKRVDVAAHGQLDHKHRHVSRHEGRCNQAATGDALVNVIITKLPFVAPDRPILAARQEAIQDAGGQPFFDYQVPQAVIKLKQGFGRLIRSTSDHGMVVIFDPRVLTKGYGRAFLRALPECRRFVDGVEEAAREEPEDPF